MTTITIQCPEEVLLSLNNDSGSFGRELTLAAAMKFYELGKLSSGRAADLAGIPRTEFLRRTAEFKAPIWDIDKDEINRDIANA